MNSLNLALSLAKKSIKDLLQQKCESRTLIDSENSIDVNSETVWGFIDSVSILSVGIVRVIGWLKDDIFTIPEVYCNSQPVPFRNHYRTQRKDIKGSNYSFGGVVFEYDIHMFDGTIVETIEIKGLVATCSPNCHVSITRPHYEHLLSSEKVYSRDGVYSSGLPSNEAPPYAFDVIKDLPNLMLDFGCGRGNLVHLLRKHGKNCLGIELEREQISTSLIPDVKSHILLYDGSLPLPYNTNHFKTVFGFEVLEHIENYEDVISELARITEDYGVFSVPDMSGIPLCFPKNVVPWHLLEATHVNFFTQQSFENTLKKHFSSVLIGKVGFNHLARTDFFTSLLAICRK
jgi:2-polyprenyl-3-methyl-5-hydroxy-6-metoxy-1,4-benzoquinol methylase